jgi:uncharacterized protein YjbJ (UPF0337 family)
MRNKDELKGKGKQIKGRIKDQAGELTRRAKRNALKA